MFNNICYAEIIKTKINVTFNILQCLEVWVQVKSGIALGKKR